MKVYSTSIVLATIWAGSASAQQLRSSSPLLLHNKAATAATTFQEDAWKVMAHKQAGYSCNATGITEQCGDMVCEGGVKMCLHAQPTSSHALAELVASELQVQLQQLLVEDHHFLLPHQDALQEWNDMEHTMLVASEQEEHIGMERTVVFGGSAKMEFGCKVSYGKKDGKFFKTIHCGFKGEKKGGRKPDGPESTSLVKQLRAPLVQDKVVAAVSKKDSWKVMAHKEAGYSCNATGVTKQFGDMVCEGGVKMCLHAGPAPPLTMAEMVATELHVQLQQLLLEDRTFFLPKEDTLQEWNAMERAMAVADEDDDEDDMERTVVFGGGAKAEVNCKVSYGFDKEEKKFFKKVDCGLKGEKKVSIKPDGPGDMKVFLP